MSTSTITEIEGDLFDAPDNAVLIHACNCQGSWASGIAAAFKTKYPAAFGIYRAHCQKNQPQKPSTNTTTPHPLEGTALLIPPQREDYTLSSDPHNGGKKRWVACLFTSGGYGKKKSPRDAILKNTRSAAADLMAQLEALRGEDRPGELFACRVNAGLFAVPWRETRTVLEEMGVRVTVVRPVGEPE